MLCGRVVIPYARARAPPRNVGSQFYMVSPVFIVLYMRRKWWGISATFFAIAASTAAMAIGTFARGWSALTLDGAWVIKYSEETYTTPYFRIVSYLIGMVFAMLWHEKQVRCVHVFTCTCVWEKRHATNGS